MNRRAMEGDDWNLEVNWLMVADRLRDHTCDESKKFQDCPHKACDKSRRLADFCTAKGLDLPLPPEVEIEDVAEYLRRKSCHQFRQYGRCNHRGCSHTDAIVKWLDQQLEQAAA